MRIKLHRNRSQKGYSAGLSRRLFLTTTAMAGITTTALLSGARPLLASPLDDGETSILLQMTQDIYPHPNLLTVEHYQAVVDAVLGNAEADADLAAGLRDGLAQVEAQAQDLHGVSYIEIDDADAREGILRNFQNDAFFQGLRWATYFGIYNNADVWPLFGYQGSSVEYGGYIERGFSDITFVPEGPTLAERLAAVQR